MLIALIAALIFAPGFCECVDSTAACDGQLLAASSHPESGTDCGLVGAAIICSISSTPSIQDFPLAPDQLDNVWLAFKTDQSSGPCSSQAKTASTTYYRDDHYTELDATGERVEEGNLIFQRTAADTLQIEYHVIKPSTWKGREVKETLHFTTPTKGTFVGRTANGQCVYEGAFVVLEQPSGEE